jgi:hypothetical protein
MIIALLLLPFALAALLGCGEAGPGPDTTATTSAAGPRTPSPAASDSAPSPDRPHRTPQPAHRAAPKPADADAGGAAAFLVPGGDNSIQRSGSEASAAARAAASAALHAFLTARAAGDWRRACAQLSAPILAQLAQLARRPGSTCPHLLAGLSAAVPPPARRRLAAARVGAFRVSADRGFLLFHTAAGAAYFAPMVREDGRWLLAALAPSPLG